VDKITYQKTRIKMKKTIAMILAASFVLLNAQDAKGTQAAFDITTVNGKKLEITGTKTGIRVKPYEGKMIFIEYWGTWCAPCLMSIPHHEKISQKYKDQLRIISFETTPDVNRDQLRKYVNDPKNNIDMSKIEWYIKHKATTEAAKKSLEKPIEELQKFKASGQKITYDVVAYQDGERFVNYLGQRAGWKGYLPYLMVFDKSGNFVGGLPGMPSEERLEAIIQSVLKHKK
jgi:thiol-disulfide isomerase/thioredoxin